MKHRLLCNIGIGIIMLVYVMTLSGHGKGTTDADASPMWDYFTDKQEVVITGKLYKKEHKSEKQILYLKNISIKSKKYQMNLSRIMVYDKNIEPVKLGRSLTIVGTLSRFLGARNPGNFDAAAYYGRNGIEAAVHLKQLNHVTGKENILLEALYQTKVKLAVQIIETLGEANGSVLNGILLGEKGNIESELKENYRLSGIGHILAISGLHISIIGVGFYQFCRKRTGSFLIGGILGTLFLSLYVLMIGFSLSVIRAFLMFLFRVGADITGRQYDSLTALTFSAGCVLLCKPGYIYDGGFYLSFGAVLGLVFVREICGKGIFGAIMSALLISLVLLGATLYFFYEISPYSIILNLIVIPFLTFLFILGIVGSLLSLVSPFLGTFFLQGANLIIEGYNLLTRISFKLPLSHIITGRPQLQKIIFFYLILILLVYGIKKRKLKGMKKLMLVFGFWILSIAYFEVKLSNRFSEITLIDVGQGDAILIQTPDHKNYLIDAGSSDVKEVGKYRVEPYLKYKGIDALDIVVVSHGDTDHYNGISELIQRQEKGVKIKCLMTQKKEVYNEAIEVLVNHAKKQEIKVIEGAEGRAFAHANGYLEILCSPKVSLGDANANSLVLGYHHKKFSVLLTGDIEGAGEERLTELLKVDKNSYSVLKVAHHGSKNSSKEHFLDRVNPKVALISAGEHNSYNHPHQDTISRLKECKAIDWQTKESGAIMLQSDGSTLKITTNLNGK